MELEKGICTFCRNSKVIRATHVVKEVYQIISSLFSKEILNVVEFNNIRSSLKSCPICYQKLLILKDIGNNIATTNSEDHIPKNNCLLCESGKILIKVINWKRFDKAIEDFPAKKSKLYIVCSDCLFYLDTRFDVKTRLFLRYPQVQVKKPKVESESEEESESEGEWEPEVEEEAEEQKKPQNKITIKRTKHPQSTRITNGISAHSTPISENKRWLRKKPIEIINISDDEDSPKKAGVNFDSLKGLKPLKHNKIFRGRNIVKDDSRFLNQIPYVLLKTSNAGGNKNRSKVDNKTVFANTLQLRRNKVTTPKSKRADNTAQKENQNKKNRRLSSRSMIIKRTLNKHVIVKDLSVKLARINLAQKRYLKLSRSYLENTLSAEKLSDNSDLEVSVVSDSTKVKEASISDGLNTSRDTSVKTKRKSVSFAEDKNVEIEYSPIRTKIISRRASTAANVPERLSFDDPVSEKIDDKTSSDAAEKRAKSQDAAKSQNDAKSDKLPDGSVVNGSNKEPDSSAENNEEIGKETVENSDTPRKKTVINIADLSDEEATKPTKDVVEEQSSGKKNRPRPLSKKRKADVGDGSNKTPEDSISESTDRDSPTPSKPKASVELDGTSSDKETASGTGENAEDEDKSVADLDAEIDKKDDEDSSSSRSLETKKSKQNSARSKPGPLSKKKKPLTADDTNVNDEDNDSRKDLDENKTGASEVGSSQPKEVDKADDEDSSSSRSSEIIKTKRNSARSKSGPLSKKKKSLTADDTNVNDEDNDSRKESDKKKTGVSEVGSSQSKEIDKKEDEDSSSSSSETKKSKRNSIHSKPGPLSKKKKALKADNTSLNDADRTAEEDNNSVKELQEKQTEPSEVGSSQSRDEQKKTNKNEPTGDSKKNDDEFKPIDRNLDDENKESDEEAAGGSKTDSESPTAGDKEESNSFSDNEKNDELGITEVDKDNIDSILSSFEFEQDQSDDKTSKEKDHVESEKVEDAEDSDVNCGSKRKLSDDEANTSMDKKRKKVAFCEEVL